MKHITPQWIIAALLAALLALQAATAYLDYRRQHRPLLPTHYQKVTLTNGEVYYGRLAHYGTDYPVLRRVFQIDGSAASDTTPAPRWLVDGREGADHLILTREVILHVQPVRESSVLGKALTRAGALPAPPASALKRE